MKNWRRFNVIYFYVLVQYSTLLLSVFKETLLKCQSLEN